MTITKSWEQVATATLGTFQTPVPVERRRELWWLVGSSLVVAAALLMVCLAKTQSFAELQSRLDGGELLNLNTVISEDQLVPFLQGAPLGDKIGAGIESRRPLPNVGRVAQAARPVFGRLKPLFVVRTPKEFYRKYVQWVAIYFASFFFVHFVWRWRRFRGDPAILPALQLLTGIGLTLAVSLKDPLRDTLEFEKFAWGVSAGCCLLLLPLFRAFHYRHFSRWTYTPLFLAFGRFVLLMRLGSGPTGSDARVNLGPFQPVELIKILLVLFMAGYFAHKWEWLRDLRMKKLRWIELPRIEHALPVMCAVAIALLFFFVLKDLGPALVTGFLFLAMFAIARGRWGLAALGVALLVTGVAIGDHIGKPPTVVDRVSMWLSPWDNDVKGGDQLAHSLWALATGGLWGSGPGWGDPGMIPAGHTDLVLPAIGEEWGFLGVLAIGVLFVFLIHRAFRIALKAANEYAMFLALGLGTLIALEMLLISGGVLGAIPLSGVVSPFLSSGNTAMLSNFLIFALLLGVSGVEQVSRPVSAFRKPVRIAAALLTLCAVVLLGKAFSYQVLHDRDLLARDCRAFTEVRVKRPQLYRR